MKYILLIASILTGLNAYSMCEADVLEHALTSQAEIWQISEDQFAAEVVTDEFNETYGVGWYEVYLTNDYKENYLTIDMIAYSNGDDTEITCEVVDIISDED